MLAPALMHIGGVDAESAREVRASESQHRLIQTSAVLAAYSYLQRLINIYHRVTVPIINRSRSGGRQYIRQRKCKLESFRRYRGQKLYRGRRAVTRFDALSMCGYALDGEYYYMA